jgi:hypothetical protein
LSYLSGESFGRFGNWTAFSERDTDTGSNWDLEQTHSHNDAYK